MDKYFKLNNVQCYGSYFSAADQEFLSDGKNSSIINEHLMSIGVYDKFINKVKDINLSKFTIKYLKDMSIRHNMKFDISFIHFIQLSRKYSLFRFVKSHNTKTIYTIYHFVNDIFLLEICVYKHRLFHPLLAGNGNIKISYYMCDQEDGLIECFKNQFSNNRKNPFSKNAIRSRR